MNFFKYGKRLMFLGVIGFAFVVCVGTTEAASLSVTSPSVNITAGDIVTVKVVVNADGQAVNTAEGVLQFPTDVLQALSLDKSSSIFSIWVEDPSFSNQTGQVSFSGGLPTPGYVGSNGTVLTVSFRAKRAGVATFSLADATVRANDGLGTNVLQSTGTLQVTVVNPPSAQPTPSAPAEDIPQPVKVPELVVTSLTHPSQDTWYSNDSPKFSWKLPQGALEARTGIGGNAAGTPSVRYTPAIASKLVSDLADGTFYFSLQIRTASGWSKVSRLKVNIDTTPPEPFSIEVLPLDSQKGLQIKFSTTDDLSGVDHYDLLSGGVKLASVTEVQAQGVISVPPTAPGTTTLTVVAYDKAGNTATASVVYESIERVSLDENVETTPEQSVFTLTIPYEMLFSKGWILLQYLSVFITVAGALGGVTFTLWYVWHRVHKVRRTLIRRIAATDRILHAELIEIHKALQDEVKRLKAEGMARELTSEEKRILKRFGKLADKAKRALEEELSRGK